MGLVAAEVAAGSARRACVFLSAAACGGRGDRDQRDDGSRGADDERPSAAICSRLCTTRSQQAVRLNCEGMGAQGTDQSSICRSREFADAAAGVNAITVPERDGWQKLATNLGRESWRGSGGGDRTAQDGSR